MSNSIQYDPLLARYLAAELDLRLRGRGCTAIPYFSPDLSVTLPLEGGEQLRADLHPTRGWFRVEADPDPEPAELDAVCVGVSAPPDERILHIDVDVVGRFRDQSRRLVFELHSNQWNAVVLDRETAGIVNVLRGRRAGTRALFPGQSYEAPPGAPRYGQDPVERAEARIVWEREIGGVSPEKRRTALLNGFAGTGSLNAGWILEPGDDEERFRRWWWIRSLPDPQPGTLAWRGQRQPYPVRLEGIPHEPFESLLAAMATAATVPGTARGETPEPDPIDALVQARIVAAERKLERMRTELVAAAGEAEGIRTCGDILLANLHRVSRGESRVQLTDWKGEPIEISLDPGLSPSENAARLYDLARRKQRAEEQLPELISAAEREVTKWRAALAAAATGEVHPSILEEIRRSRESRAAGAEQGTSLPYRVYRTSGGLEVRVGRSSKGNDRLTFRESSPNDVWLHAQSVPGSHVILRWSDMRGAPPARDLEEAAQLAALFSRARTSALVAVDWTRRKYVRKPRGAAPGLVIPQRVKTLFVEPVQEVAERLAVTP